MNTITHGVILTLCFIALALAGQWVVSRTVKTEVLELHHSAGEAMMGVVGTLFSVLLGFMVASAMDTYHDAKLHDEQEASNIATIFRLSRGMSEQDRVRLRRLCREYVDAVVDNEWPQMEHRIKINHGWEKYTDLWEASISAVPENDRQSNIQQVMLSALQDLGENRRARILLANKQTPVALWLIVAVGAIITVSLSYVFASRFPQIQSFMTTLVATALSLNIWLLAAYSNPYSGELAIKPTMFELLKENVFILPDTPPRYLHDAY